MTNSHKELLMSGNEAIARGSLEAGVRFCASYPGTPSTEITESLIRTKEGSSSIHVEWSTNEKVALEASAGASWAGIPALCPMKSLGLNVASDFLLNLNLTGTGTGGLVIVVCDDPQGHSSSNEQDSRFYAKAAKIPLLEPSTYQDAKDIIPFAFHLSKDFEIPVIVRSTTRLSHSRGIVRLGQLPRVKMPARPLPPGLFNVPQPTKKHRELLAKLQIVSERYDRTEWNRVTGHKSAHILVISSGVSTRYAEEAVRNLAPDKIAVLGLITSYPIPVRTITDIMKDYEKVVFIEENSPFIEDEIRGLATTLENVPKLFGIRTGETLAGGEMNTDRAGSILASRDILDLRRSERNNPQPESLLLSERPLTFCAGCTHRNFYYAIKKLKKRLEGNLVVAGDIGCYSLGVFYDEAMNTMQAMGSGIGVASGLGQLGRFGFNQKVLAVAGDSTFFHACIPALVNCRHKNANVTFVILDNETTAMTGFQPHPGSKHPGADKTKLDIAKLVDSVEPDYFERGSAAEVQSLTDFLHNAVKKEGLKVVLLDSICRLEETRRTPVKKQPRYRVDPAQCRGETCRICVRDFGCPAMTWDSSSDCVQILEQQCVACGACVFVCPHGAIREVD